MILMDAAAEAGARVAQRIVSGKDTYIVRKGPYQDRPLAVLLAPLWALDACLFRNGYHHIANGHSILFLIVYAIVIVLLALFVGYVVWRLVEHFW